MGGFSIGFSIPVAWHVPVGAALIVLSLVPAGLQLSKSVAIRGEKQAIVTTAKQAAADAAAIGLVRAQTCLVTALGQRIEAGAKPQFKQGTVVPEKAALCDAEAGFTAEVRQGVIVDVQPIEINRLQQAIADRNNPVGDSENGSQHKAEQTANSQ